MADFQAIGGVSETLRALLLDRMELPANVGTNAFAVTIGPPRAEVPEGGQEAPRVNLFLYRVAENAALKNQDLPGTGHPGGIGHPPLSLDLHYLLTAYGTNEDQMFVNEVTAHFLLGSAMRVLHDHAIITDTLTTANAPLPRPILHASLQGEYENLRLAIDPLGLEDLSKVWTALTLPFRVSAAYQVTVVQIESQRRRRFPRPVGEPPAAGPRVFVAPMRLPHIAELGVQLGAEERRTPYVRIGDVLVLHGTAFGKAPLRVALGDIDVTTTPRADDRVEVTLPDDPALQPGPQTVELRTSFPGLPATLVRSNHAAFMLVPRVATATLAPDRLLIVGGTRLLLAGRGGETIVGRHAVDAQRYTAGSSPTSLQLPLPDALPGAGIPIRLSSPLTPFPTFSGTAPLEFMVQLGAASAVRGALPASPTSLAEAARLLEAALHAISATTAPPLPAADVPAYREARVGLIGDRLAVFAGGMRARFAFTDVAGDPTATNLGLVAGVAAEVSVSGALDPFPPLSHASPRLVVSVNGAPAGTAVLASGPTSLAGAATALQSAVAPLAGLTGTTVGVVGTQLIVAPPTPGTLVLFAPDPGVDEASVVELQLRARYVVRVRVNGAEGIDAVEVSLPA